MQKSSILACLLLIFSTLAYGQNAQWANSVVNFSSELSPNLYSAKQALGPPNVPENEGDSPNAWAPKRPDRPEFLILGYNTPIRVQQIAVHESFNPSAITEIYLIDTNDQPHLIFEGTPRQLNRQGRLRNIFFSLTDYEVKAVEIRLEGAAVEGVNCIDAVAISDSNIPIDIEIPKVPEINEELTVKKLGPNVNSQYSEVGPVLTTDGKILFFSRFNHPGNVGGEDDPEDIWYSEFDDATGEWGEAKNIGPPLNNADGNYVNSAFNSGNEISLVLANEYLKKGKVRPGVSISHHRGDGWSIPEALKIDKFYNLATNGEFFVSADTSILLMSIEQEDSRGLVDLYVSFSDSAGTWSAPKNLGSTINTVHEELSPMLLEDNRTLFFASAGHGGHGGTDIWVSERLDDSWTNWSQPANLGAGVNTENDELHLTLHEETEIGLFAREVNGNSEIYQFNRKELFTPPPKFITVELEIADEKSKEALQAMVLVEERTGRGQYSKIAEMEAAEVHGIKLDLGKAFRITASADGYLKESLLVDLTSKNESKENRTYDLELKPEPPKEVMEVIDVEDINFQFDSFSLTRSSTDHVDKIVALFKEKKLNKIELSGHTDNTGDEDYNMILSEKRTKAVKDIFIGKGLSESQIQMKWYGETSPKYSNDSADNRAKNRRVEIRIIN